MSYDGSSAKSYIRHATEKERLDNLAFTSFPEDYLPYAASPGHPRAAAPPPYLLWGDDRRRRPPKKRRKSKCAGALLFGIGIVVLAILVVVAVSAYLGVVTNFFRSPVVTVSGRFLASEEFTEELLNSSSTKFLEKTEFYQSKVEKAFLSSSLEPAYIATRVYSFRPGLVVFFRVYLDRRKIKQNGEESPPTELVRELVAEKLTTDPDSVHTEESEELSAVELRPVETIHSSILKKPPPSKPPASSTTRRNGQRLPPSGGVGVWRPIPIEDTVSPSFADRPIIGAGSVQSPEENSGKNPADTLTSEKLPTDNSANSQQSSTINQEGVGSVKVLEDLPGRRPPFNPLEGTGSVRLLEEHPLRNVQPIPPNTAATVRSSKESGRRPQVPTDRREGVGSVRLLPESHADTSKISTFQQGAGSVRLVEVGLQASSKPLSNIEAAGSVHMLEDNSGKNLPSQGNPSINEGFIDPPTLAPSVMLVVRNRSRSDKPRNLLTRLEKGHQSTGHARSENIGISSVREIVAESLPIPFKKEPPVISSRLLDLNLEITTEKNLDERHVTEVVENNGEIVLSNISTSLDLENQNYDQFPNKEDLKLVTNDSVENDATLITLTTEVSGSTFTNTAQLKNSKSTLENILFSHPQQNFFEATEVNLNNYNDEISTEPFTGNNVATSSNKANEMTSTTNESKDDSIETDLSDENFSGNTSTTKNSNDDVHSSIVNYSPYIFTEPHFHAIENESDVSSDSYEVHTLIGHGFHKPLNSSNGGGPSNLTLPDSTTVLPITSSMTILDENKSSTDFGLLLQTVSFSQIPDQTESLNEQSVKNSPENLENYSNISVTKVSVLSNIETKVTKVYDDTSDSPEEIFSNIETINTTTDDTSQQAKVVPQMKTDLLSNDIEEPLDENNHFGNEILRHITTLHPQLNGSDSFLQSCPSGSVPCDATGESCGIRCDMRKDCSNNADETSCKCSDLLRAMGQAQKICDGIEDCSDKSDEANCPWCPSADYFRCPGSRTCITMDRVCDGKDDCPGAQDERRCVNLAESSVEADSYDYRSEGYLIVRRSGQWGKLCLDALTRSSDMDQKIKDLGKAVCSALTYRNMSSSVHAQDTFEPENSYYQIATGSANQSSSSSLFEPTSCKRKEVLRVQCKTLECGLRPSAPPSQRRRIVGGRSADNAGSWPWAVALYREGDFQCGAALISDVWLVSAAHCFYSSQKAYWTARLGVLRRGSELPTSSEQVRRIKDIILHPEYEDEGFINDIALLRMDQRVPFSDTLRPICLPSSPSEDASLWHGRRCSVVGWGKLYEIGHTFPDSLQEVRLPVISSSECQRRSIFLPAYRITPKMFCAGFDRGGRDACLGDSGGPMACQRPADGRWILLGITSNGDGCGRPNRPGVYSQVAGFLTWIQEVISDDKVFEGNTGLESMCSSGVRCRLGRCIPRSRLCDGRRDCAGGEDEMDC